VIQRFTNVNLPSKSGIHQALNSWHWSYNMVKLQFTFKTMSFKFINSSYIPKYTSILREVINNRPNTFRVFLLQHRKVVISALYKGESLARIEEGMLKAHNYLVDYHYFNTDYPLD
jgi:hypothetical protein